MCSIFVLWFLFGNQSVLNAARLTTCDHLDLTLARSDIANEPVSVEIELDLTPGLVELFQTSDQTLQPLFVDVAVPDFLKPHLDPTLGLMTPFDKLTALLKIKVLDYIWRIKVNEHEKFTDSERYPDYRRIKGLLIKPTLNITVTHSLEYDGVRYVPGSILHIETKDVFGSHVEWHSAVSEKESVGIEIHMRRSAKFIKELLHDSWAFQRNFAGDSGHVHLHLPVSVRAHRFNKSFRLESLKLVVFQIFGEIVSTLHWLKFKQPLIQDGFSWRVNRIDFSTIYSGLIGGIDPRFGHKNFFGFRFGIGYTNPNLMGVENRTAADFLDSNFVVDFSKAAYYRLLHRDYFMSVHNLIYLLTSAKVSYTRSEDGIFILEDSLKTDAIVRAVIFDLAFVGIDSRKLPSDYGSSDPALRTFLNFFYTQKSPQDNYSISEEWKNFAEIFPEMTILLHFKWNLWKVLLDDKNNELDLDIFGTQLKYLPRLQTIKNEYNGVNSEKTRDKILALVNEFTTETKIYDFFTTAFLRLNPKVRYDELLTKLLK